MECRKDIYGTKKQFIAEHFEDIQSLRKRMSAKQISVLYSGLISEWDVYEYIPKKSFPKKTIKVKNINIFAK
ncbi:MAG TPA: hypothetical protein DCS17_07375 [Flavobacterium sp.]|nr:hypothetical protein [Flavobacterium sp.]